MDWYFDVLKKYATFSGRARRKEFWMFLLFHFIIVVILGFVDGSLNILGRFNPDVAVPEGFSFTVLYILATLLPSLAVSVRRLHDTNRSGWWVFISFVPIVGPFVILVFMAPAGDTGENKYGPNPKAAAAAIEEKSL